MRKPLSESEQQNAEPFRMRGKDVLRIEGFSDTVMGFALTLLVVSLEVPRSYDEMIRALRGLPAFAVCFYIFYLIWQRHYQFFRRYGLQDGVTLGLNGMLLFVLLMYVFPLKFVFSLFIGSVMGWGADGLQIQTAQLPALFVLYGVGFAAVFGLFALFHANALRQKTELQLTEYETQWTRIQVKREILMAGIGIVSVIMARIFPPKMVALSGFAYFLIGAVEGWAGSKAGKLYRAEIKKYTPVEVSE